MFWDLTNLKSLDHQWKPSKRLNTPKSRQVLQWSENFYNTSAQVCKNTSTDILYKDYWMLNQWQILFDSWHSRSHCIEKQLSAFSRNWAHFQLYCLEGKFVTIFQWLQTLRKTILSTKTLSWTFWTLSMNKFPDLTKLLVPSS